MKVTELEGALLDYWVAMAEGEPVIDEHGLWDANWHPSTDWSQGGPLIAREKIDSRHLAKHNSWVSRIEQKSKKKGPILGCGNTMLVAAMRCYVASKFGDEVPDAPG